MHSRHATSTAQEALDALMIKYPPCQLAIASTSAKPTVTDCQDHAPRSSHHHSRTVGLRHDCGYGICYLQDVGRFHYCFICYELFHLSHLLSVRIVLQVIVSCLLSLFESSLHVWFQVMFGLRLCFHCVSLCLKFVSCLFGICL
jgi:hypothetical protein